MITVQGTAAGCLGLGLVQMEIPNSDYRLILYRFSRPPRKYGGCFTTVPTVPEEERHWLEQHPQAEQTSFSPRRN
jgi:hypothetical protein